MTYKGATAPLPSPWLRHYVNVYTHIQFAESILLYLYNSLHCNRVPSDVRRYDIASVVQGCVVLQLSFVTMLKTYIIR